MNVRNLTQEEITSLSYQGCTASDWQRILVAPYFKTDFIHHTRFSGDVCLGVFEHEFILDGGVPKHSGLNYVTLHN